MAKAKPRVCVVGSTNIDLTFRTARLPQSGETLTGESFRLSFGGKGANQAVMAARLGGRVTMLSRVGRDDFGQRILANYRSHGIDTNHVATDSERPTGIAAIMVDAAAHNCIVVVAGANGAVSVADVRAAADALRSANVVVAQCETPLGAAMDPRSESAPPANAHAGYAPDGGASR